MSKQGLQQVFYQAFLPELEHALQKLFQAADDALIKKAQLAAENKEQNRYFEAVQSLRIMRQGVVRQFFQNFKQQALLEVVDREHLNSLRRLLTVEPEAFQRDDALAASLLDLDQRIQDANLFSQNPLQPVFFADCFLQSLAAANVDMHIKMLLLRLYENQLYSQLPAFASQANEALSEAGVLPQLKTQAQQSLQPEASQTAIETTPLEHALAELQANEVEKLYEILDASPEKWPEFFPGIHDIAKRLEQSGLLPKPLSTKGKVQMQQLPLVQKIFTWVDSDNNTDEIAKAMLQALHVPFARLALADASFFNNQQHDARQLLHDMVLLAQQWQPEKQLATDSVYQKFLAIVQSFLEAEWLQSLNIKAMQLEVIALAEQMRQNMQRFAEQFEQSAYGVQASEQARQAVAELLEAELKAYPELPAALRNLTQKAWAHVLYMQALEHGVQSPKWQQSKQVLQQLIDSFCPKEPYQNRMQLLAKLPPLLRGLREGMQEIALKDSLIEHLFADLEAAHKALAITVEAGSDEQLKAMLEKSTSKAEAADEPEPTPDTAEPETDAELDAKQQYLLNVLKPGMLMHWHSPEGLERCRLAAIIKHIDSYVITDRSGKKLAQWRAKEIARKLVSKELELQESGANFDQTLASVIGEIRGNA